MSWRVDDDVLAFLGLEPNLSGVDGDVLVALGLKRIHQVGPLEGHAATLGDELKLLKLAFGERASVVEQTSDKSRFAVVNMTDDDDFELFGRGVGLHEKNGLNFANNRRHLHGVGLTYNRRGAVSRKRLRFPCPAHVLNAQRSWYDEAPR